MHSVFSVSTQTFIHAYHMVRLKKIETFNSVKSMCVICRNLSEQYFEIATSLY